MSALLLALLIGSSIGGQQNAGATALEVRPFAGRDRVRIEVRLDTAKLAAAPETTRFAATIRDASTQAELWSGPLRKATALDGRLESITDVTKLAPALWSPQTPHLYLLRVRVSAAEKIVAEKTVRFGFRSVEARAGRIYLNGAPVFLRGNAINPPGRTLPRDVEEHPSFVRDYIRYLKSIGVNWIRPQRHSDVWLDTCDELGMMVFAGKYGIPPGGTQRRPPKKPFAESLRWYRDTALGPHVRHPCVIVHVFSNELAAPEIYYLGHGGADNARFLKALHMELREWDPNRLYIGNAGFGRGRSGDVCDVHRYWGWYYNSFLSFYTLRDPTSCWGSEAVQPITISEGVGCYTGPSGRFNIVPNTKQPDSQLNWTGHAPPREQSERALRYQSFLAKQAIEITRRTRTANPHLAGIAPFTILFHEWNDVKRFDDMRPKPVAEQFAISYQPVLLSFELWTSQVYAGSKLAVTAHVVNDSDDRRSVAAGKLRWQLLDKTGAVKERGEIDVPSVAYFGVARVKLEIELAATLATGSYHLTGEIVTAGKVVSRNEVGLFVASRSENKKEREVGAAIAVYDPPGATLRALTKLGIEHRSIVDLDSLGRERLVIGARAFDEKLSAPRLLKFVRDGGRLLFLAQDPESFDPKVLGLPARMATAPLDHSQYYPVGLPFRQAMAINPERPGHPVFDGIDRDRLFLWSDYADWSEDKAGLPNVYPVTSGFALTGDAWSSTAVLANYGHGLCGTALAEFTVEKGSMLLSGFDLVNRAGADPIADRLLRNLVHHLMDPHGHEARLLVEDKIVWGDYESEGGLVTGYASGLRVHPVPIVPARLQSKFPLVIHKDGFHLAGRSGGWNSRPAIEYVARGRRPFGPFAFSRGGMPRLKKDAGPDGVGTFYCRVPSDRRVLRTRVSNPAAAALQLTVEVNGRSVSTPIGAEQTLEIRSDLKGDTSLAIRYSGDRRLVLLESEFERAANRR